MREYKVATFFHTQKPIIKASHISAYLRDYNTQWSGCKVYTVIAVNGKDAKKLAIQKRLAYEQNK